MAVLPLPFRILQEQLLPGSYKDHRIQHDEISNAQDLLQQGSQS